ncbi:LPD7 domain-containing protein [Brevundimonas vesicularis]|uniref:LPD7 domain-containing protein n=1 Tax=Brevundimonas vesicularis TaxID=41276 RepID=UPI0008319C62|nr:LPD7 domain-containing protein [Brevundimonas vesicularis]
MSQSAPRPTPSNRLAPQPGAAPERRSLDKGDVPAQLLDRYLIERDRQGRPERYYRDHKTADPVFRDHGRALSSLQAYPDSVASMLRIAQHRGWTHIKVSGDEAFRREVWVQGRSLGLEVAGHKPTERDRQAANDQPDRVAGGRPSRDAETKPATQTVKRRLELAAVVVRTLIADPAVQTRLMKRAWSRARSGAEQTHARDPGKSRRAERSRER